MQKTVVFTIIKLRGGAQMDKKWIGQKISSIRKEKGLTQKVLAERLCVTDKTVSKWETGVNFPDIAILEDLAKVLDISVVELLGLEIATSEEVIREITEISIEEKLEIKKEMRMRLWFTIISAIILVIFETYFFWYLHTMGFKGVEYRVFTIGLIGAIGGILGGAIYNLENIRKL